MMNKLFAIYLCSLVIVISIVLPLAFPALLVATYMTESFSRSFIVILITTILVEPFAITGSYMILTNVKDIYNGLRMWRQI